MTRGDTRRALGTVRGGLRELFAVRWIRWTLVLFLLVLMIRIGLEQLLATTVNRLAAERGLVCDWEDLDLSLFSGRGEVHLLSIRPLSEEDSDAGDPLLDIEYAVFDLDVLELLTGKLRIARAEVDGLDSWWIREPNGEWNVGHHVRVAEILALMQSEPETAPQEEEDEEKPLDLSPPLAIEALRFQHATYRVVDRVAVPPVELAFEVTAGLSHLNDPDRPVRFSATILGGDLVDAAHVEGTATWNADEIALQLRAQAGSFHPGVLARYLEPLDIRPAAESIEARLLADVRIAVAGEARDSLRARAELSEIHLLVDGSESLALDRLLVELGSYSSQGAVLPGVTIEGIRGRASLESDSALRIAGLDITGTRWIDVLSGLSAAPPSSSEETGVPSWLALLFEKDAEAYAWSLGSLDVRAGLIEFTDRTVEPEASFPFHIDTVHIGEVAHVPGTETRTIPINAGFRAPGMAEKIAVKGSLGPFAPKRSVDLDLQVDGIVLESVQHHLQRAGVERALQYGSFHARLVGEAETDKSGRTEGHLELDRIELEDEGKLFGIEKIRATGLLLDPTEKLLRFGELEISGTRLSMGRDPSQRFFALGLRSLGFTPEESPAPEPALGDTTPEKADESPAGASPSVPASIPPRIELGRFAWTDSDVEFVDQLTVPPRRFSFDELGLEITDLTLGGDPAGPSYEPARFSARLVAPGILDQLTAEGRIYTNPGPIDLSVELALRGEGGSGELVRPYLRALGVEPTFEDALLSLDLQASLKRASGGWLAGVTLRDASLRDGDSLLLSCEELRVDDVRVDGGIEVGAISLVNPYVGARRDENGELVVAGVRLVRAETEAPADDGEAEAATLALPLLPDVRIESAAVTGARLSWADAMYEPQLETELVIDASARELRTDATPATFQARLHVPATLERLDVQGSLTIGPEELSLSAVIEGEGVRAGPLARLLPEGLELESSAGRLQGELEAKVRQADEGGLQASLLARNCAWGESDTEPWVALASAHVFAPRVDPAAGVVTVGPVTVQGVTIEAARTADGKLHFLGLALGEAPQPTRPAPEEDEGDTEAQVTAPESALPRIELVDDVTLQLERLHFRDTSLGPDAQPLEVGATFRLATPLVVMDTEPEELDPIDWQVTGSLAGLVERWSLSGRLAPFAPEPRFEAAFEATGVRTAGVVERVPQLAGRLEGEVEQGTLAAAMKGTLFVRRARPTELGLSRPFSAELLIEGVEYRASPDGEILAGVDQITAEIERVDPDRGLVHVDTVEILRPRGVVQRKGQTLRALGFALHLDAAESSPESEAAATETVEAAAPTVDREEAIASELRIDQIVVSGLDFELRDDTADPAVRIPLTKLDAEIKRFTTRALVEDRPIHFSSYLEAGTVAEDDGIAVFEEIAVAGRVSLYPEPAGWAQLSMTGLELPELAALAAAEGLTIEDGALDASIRLRLEGADGANVDSTLVFTDLSLDEPEGGFLERALSLPMALDSALFLLKNADGEHRFSTGFSVDEEGLSGAQMTAAATRAFAEVLARALAAVPLRLLGALIPGGEEKEERPDEAWTIPFSLGATEPGPALLPNLRAAAARVKSKRSNVLVLRHELTAEDAAHAERLANPSEATCRELVRGLRQRKSELLRVRAESAAEARAMYAIGDERALAASADLRAHERELAFIEQALDRMFEVLRSDSARQRQKRTRSTAREIAELRLATVQAELQRALPGSARERVEVRAPRFEIVPGPEAGRVVIELRER